MNYLSLIFNSKKIQNLQSVNRSKETIIANVAHEIRNPISIIIGAAYLLKKNFNNAELSQESQECLDAIEEFSQETLHFVQDLLETSQLSSGRFSINLSNKTDLKPLIQRVIKTSKYLYLQNNVTINHKIDPFLPKATLDPRRMKQILVNLISNSIKYSNDNIIIDIVAKHLKSENKILISISDNGIGMTKYQIQKALKKFKTINDYNPNKIDSFGLGLPLVKYLVESQNGTMQIQSAKEVGTTTNLYFNLNTK